MTAQYELHEGRPTVVTMLTVSPGVISSLLNCKSPRPSADVELLFRLMKGKVVKMRLYNAQNIMFYVTAEQLDAAVAEARVTWERCYLSILSPERLSALYNKFADEKMAMSIQSFHIMESLDEINERLKLISQHQPLSAS